MVNQTFFQNIRSQVTLRVNLLILSSVQNRSFETLQPQENSQLFTDSFKYQITIFDTV